MCFLSFILIDLTLPFLFPHTLLAFRFNVSLPVVCLLCTIVAYLRLSFVTPSFLPSSYFLQ